jgi:hypothetical protein
MFLDNLQLSYIRTPDLTDRRRGVGVVSVEHDVVAAEGQSQTESQRLLLQGGGRLQDGALHRRVSCGQGVGVCDRRGEEGKVARGRVRRARAVRKDGGQEGLYGVRQRDGRIRESEECAPELRMSARISVDGGEGGGEGDLPASRSAWLRGSPGRISGRAPCGSALGLGSRGGCSRSAT